MTTGIGNKSEEAAATAITLGLDTAIRRGDRLGQVRKEIQGLTLARQDHLQDSRPGLEGRRKD